jgi:hypothetical protein
MLIKTTASQVQYPSMGIHPSTGTCTPPRVTTADALIARTKAILSLPPSLLQKQRRSALKKLGIPPVRKISVPVYVFVPDREPDCLTDSHVKLGTLVDTQ